MIKTLISSLALAFVALTANALTPSLAHADTCSDLQSIVQNPQGGTGGAAAADAIKSRAQSLSTILCPSGASADATAPTTTPAQLGAATVASTCPAYTDPPTPAAGATRAAIRTGATAFNTWATAAAASQTCHHDEVTKAQHETAVYDASALIYQQHYTTQVTQLQASFDTQRTAFMRAHANQ